MAGNKSVQIAVMWFFFLCTMFTTAEQTALLTLSSPDGAALFSSTESTGYSYIIDENGNPIYSQCLSWLEDPYALAYEVTVCNNAGSEIIKTRVEETILSLNLSPGEYSYNIVTINLLEQPETETGYQPLNIIRAEIPNISNVSPGFIFMDSFNSLVTIQGSFLQEDARVLLRKRGNTTERGIQGSLTSWQGESEIVVEFPVDAYIPGVFNIAVINPGGLIAIKKDAIRILYQRPVDILLSAGYSPALLFHDTWFKETWSDSVYWGGADASLSVYFLKKSWGFLGLGIDLSAHQFTGGIDMAAVTSDYLIPSLNLLYRFRINRLFYLLARAGGGVYVSHHSFDYQGEQGPEDDFSGISLQSGLAVQCFLPHHLYIELGADWVELFAEKNKAGLLRPLIHLGYQLF